MFDVFENDHELVIVLERMDMDLYDYLQKHGPIPEDKARVIIKTMAQAIKHCHDNGIIHRDLKLDNILVRVDKHANIIDLRLADFGISK